MKKLTLLSSFIFVLVLSINVFSQAPPPPPGGGHGQNNNQPAGGGADIGGGLFLLAFLGAGYGIKKFFNYQKPE